MHSCFQIGQYCLLDIRIFYDRFNYDVLNHTDLTRLRGKSGEINLETINWGNYDLVVIDSPPLLPVVDTRILREMADMLVFVVRAGSTPPQAVVRSLQNLRGVAGVVFNGVSRGSFRRYYYYDAYSRYAYGDEGATDADEDSKNA